MGALTTNAGKKIVTKGSDHIAVADGTTDVYDEHGTKVPYPNTVPSSGVHDASTNTTIGDFVVSLLRSSYGPADQIHGIPAGRINGGFNGEARPVECSRDVRIEGIGPCRTDDKTKHNTRDAGNADGRHVEATGTDTKANNVICINYDFVKEDEGPKKKEGYVPANLNQATGKLERIGRSGITIGSGVDLGQQGLSDGTKTELQKLGLSQPLYDKLVPYTTLTRDQVNSYANDHPDVIGQRQLDGYARKQKKKADEAAAKFVGPPAPPPTTPPPPPPPPPTPMDPLVLDDKEMEELDDKVYAKNLKDLQAEFNTSGKKFAELPCEVQTALFATYLNSRASARALFGKIRSGDYAGARDVLYKADDVSNQGLKDRRRHDGEKLNEGIPDAADKKSYATWQAEQDAAKKAAEEAAKKAADEKKAAEDAAKKAGTPAAGTPAAGAPATPPAPAAATPPAATGPAARPPAATPPTPPPATPPPRRRRRGG